MAPGSATDLEIIKKACTVLESWGYRTRVASDIMRPDLFLSHSDSYRFQSLKKSLMAKDSRAVWCVRGGYGSIRLLPQLNRLKKPKKPKLLIGFSDVTSIQIFLAQKWNWPSLHGPLLDRLGLQQVTTADAAELQSLLRGKNETYSPINLTSLNPSAERKKSLQGIVIGGNLMVATSTLGTPNQLNGRGKILFFEELGERGYRIDRCLQQMLQAGLFDEAQAVVFGEFTKCGEPDGKDLSMITLKNFFSKLKVPAFFGFPTGHGVNQRPIFFNARAQITRLTVDQSQFQMLICSPYEVHQPRK